MTDKPHAPATERNREPILAVLRDYLRDGDRVLEIGSGTGQHAVFFAAVLPGVQWQCSDRADQLSGMRAWLDEAALPNLLPPLVLDVGQAPWPQAHYDVIFTANTLHIMAWPEVEALFARLSEILTPAARMVIYGPFNYGGQFTSASNAQFEQWLKSQDARRGIRDFEAVEQLARQAGLRLVEDRAMPANNRCLVLTAAPG